MRRRFALVLGTLAVALAVSGSALAFDCMRVSSSLSGLQQSTANSGNWLLFDMTPGRGGVAQVVEFFGLPGSVACYQTAYDAATGVPTYFALGIGVAGARAGHGPEVLAHNAPGKVLANGTGIDHFDDTVAPIFIAAIPGCAGT
jgi:hypothetical protein